jgi:hypothetical protein
MSIENEQQYQPYAATSKAIVEVDKNIIEQIFPDANPDKMSKLTTLISGLVLEGIYTGQASSDTDPIEPINAYNAGYQEGYKRAILDSK